jgi:hypothetical protein
LIKTHTVLRIQVFCHLIFGEGVGGGDWFPMFRRIAEPSTTKVRHTLLGMLEYIR